MDYLFKCGCFQLSSGKGSYNTYDREQRQHESSSAGGCKTPTRNLKNNQKQRASSDSKDLNSNSNNNSNLDNRKYDSSAITSDNSRNQQATQSKATG